mgnify:CR=1 FL=1
MKRSKVEETGKMDGKEFKKALEYIVKEKGIDEEGCRVYTSPSRREGLLNSMPSSA